MWKEVARGGVSDLYSGVRYYEGLIPEGSKVLCRFNLRTSLSPATVSSLEQKMEDAGVKDVRVTTGSPILNVFFTKGFPWLAIVVSFVLVIAILIISWRLLIWVEETVPGAVSTGVKFLLIGGIGVIAILLMGALTKTKREFSKGGET